MYCGGAAGCCYNAECYISLDMLSVKNKEILGMVLVLH